MNYNLIFLDTETTGNTPTDRLVQVCYKNSETKEIFEQLFLPPVPITVEAMEVTNITPKMVANKEPFVGSLFADELQQLLKKENSVFVAHNAPFDVAMLERESIVIPAVIDTLKIARFLDPDAKLSAYRLQYLRYFLDLDSEIDQPIIAHDAKGDVLVLEKLFDRLFNKIKIKDNLDDNQAIEEMIKISSEPILVGKFAFGKYRGELIKEIAQKDLGYLEWLYKQKTDNPDSDRDADLLYTLNYYLNNR